MENKKDFETVDIFVFLWKKRKPLIIVTVIGAVVSIIVSLMLQNYYKAETVIFPTKFIGPSTSLLNKNTNQETDALLIGDEDDLERMIQILNSDYITNRIIKKYNLIEHYDFKKDDPHLRDKLYKAFHSNISYKKTKYQGIIVSVIDADPQTSADIANDIASLVDSLIYDMQRQRKEEAYRIAKEVYENELAYVKSVEDSIDIYRQKGLLNLDKEIDRYSEAYAKSVGYNRLTPKAAQMFDEKFKLIQKYGKDLHHWVSVQEIVVENLEQFRANLVQAEHDLKKPFSHKYVISYAQAPDKKDSPKRSIIVIFSTFGTFIFAIFMLLLLDFFKEIKTRIKE